MSLNKNNPLTEKEKQEIEETLNESTIDIPDNLNAESDEKEFLNSLDEIEYGKGVKNIMPQVIDDYGSYEVPKGDSQFLKLEDGENRIRLASKPMELKLHEIAGAKYNTKLCQGENCELCAKGNKLKYRYAYIVLDRKTDQFGIYEAPITVFRQIAALALNEEYGDPTKYDLTIRKEGEKPQITYTIVPSPKQVPLTKEELELLEESKLNLEEFYTKKN